MRFERDDVELLGGVRHGLTLGSPVVDRDPQHRVAEVAGGDVAGAGRRPRSPCTSPGPATPTSSGMQKYGFDDARNVLERASARETAARVAAGTLAKLLLAELGTEVLSHVIQMGAARARRRAPARPRPTSPRSTTPRCAASTPTPRPR